MYCTTVRRILVIYAVNLDANVQCREFYTGSVYFYQYIAFSHTFCCRQQGGPKNHYATELSLNRIKTRELSNFSVKEA